jgi:hypothetical protein
MKPASNAKWEAMPAGTDIARKCFALHCQFRAVKPMGRKHVQQPIHEMAAKGFATGGLIQKCR